MAARKIVNEADIGRVRDQLDQAIESLVERGLEATGVDELRQAARLLEEIRLAAVSQPPSRALAAALRDLAPRAARAGELLDSAAAFYRGWLQVSPAPVEDYTPEGAWASPAFRSSAGGGLSIEA
jgi:hypothetical protein